MNIAGFFKIKNYKLKFVSHGHAPVHVFIGAGDEVKTAEKEIRVELSVDMQTPKSISPALLKPLVLTDSSVDSITNETVERFEVERLIMDS